MRSWTRTYKTLALAGVMAIALGSASASLAQTDSQSTADRARESQIKVLKSKIDKLQAHLSKLESERHSQVASPSTAAAKGGKDCCAAGAPVANSGTTGVKVKSSGALAQASPASEPSAGAGAEHPTGEGMGAGGMGGSMEHGKEMMGGAGPSAAASPGAMPMEEHMKGMHHMHGMMHGGAGSASPAASPGAMPMEHGKPMEHPMGGMGGSGMGGEGMQGGAGGGAQPQASPSAGMGGMQDDM